MTCVFIGPCSLSHSQTLFIIARRRSPLHVGLREPGLGLVTQGHRGGPDSVAAQHLDRGAVALCGLLRGAEELLDHTQRQVTFADLMCTL